MAVSDGRKWFCGSRQGLFGVFLATSAGAGCGGGPPSAGGQTTGADITLSGAESSTEPDFDQDETSLTPSGSTGSEGPCGGACEDEVCIDGECCGVESACDEVCCGETEVCSFAQCVTPGPECVDAADCPEGDYCEYSLGEPASGEGEGACQAGVTPATGRCLAEPPQCPDGVVPQGDDIDCLPACEVIPEPSFSPQLKYHWDLGDSMMAPVVVQLDDDNCDTVVDERDIPEIAFTTFDGGLFRVDGTLHVISIIDGTPVEKWSAHPVDVQINPGRSMAAGNIDGVPGNELVVCLTNGGARAYTAEGAVLWTSDYVGGCFMPSIADLDQDGAAEVVLQNGIVSGATGSTTAVYTAAGGESGVVTSDVDGDGELEVVGPNAAFDSEGTQIAMAALSGTHPAVADFDGDGAAEVAVIDYSTHSLAIWRVDPLAPTGATIIRSGININGDLGSCSGGDGGGPPTIADFNGDGVPDIGVAAGVGYAVFDGAELLNPAVVDVDTLMWIVPAADCSSRQTGSSVFDFDGDGSAEVVYADEHFLRIYDGPTGDVLFETCNTTGTLWEYPLVADVDNDGHADIVVVSNDYSPIFCPLDDSQQQGVRVFGDQEGKWVRTRAIWNQHAYHVTNVEENGDIPSVEVANWTVPGLNNFRQNVQPQGEFSAPDLVASLRPICTPGEYGIAVTVRNIGRAAVPAGVPVTFYAGDPAGGGAMLGVLETTNVLYPAQGELLELTIEGASQDLRDGTVEAFVTVDEASPVHTWKECRTDNNTAFAAVPCNSAG